MDNARALVVDSFWRGQEGVHSRRPQNLTSTSYLKSCKNPLGGFSEEVFAQFEVRFDVGQIVPQIVPVFLCDRTGLTTGEN